MGSSLIQQPKHYSCIAICIRFNDLPDGNQIACSLGGPPHPVIVTIRDNRDYIRVLLSSYYTTITGWGVLLTYPPCPRGILATSLGPYTLNITKPQCRPPPFKGVNIWIPITIPMKGRGLISGLDPLALVGFANC